MEKANINMAQRLRFPHRTLALLLAMALIVASFAWFSFAQAPKPPGYRSYPLRYAQAAELAPQLQGMLNDLGVQHELLVDRTRNLVLIKGTEESQRFATQLINTLDRPAPAAPANVNRATPPVVRGYAVPADQADTVTRELQERFPAASGVRIANDPRTGQVIVVAPESTQQQIAELLNAPADASGPTQATPSQPDAGQPAAESTRPAAAANQPSGRGHQLRQISWQQLEDGLQRVWGRRIGLTNQRNGEVSVVSVASASGVQPVMQIDRRRNWVEFIGPPRFTEIWQRVVAALDVQQDGDQETELVPLARAEPERVQRAVNLLQAVARANQQAQTGGRNDLVAMIFQQNAGDAPGDANPNAGGGGPQPPADQPGGQPMPAKPQPGGQPAQPGDGPRPLPKTDEEAGQEDGLQYDVEEGGAIGPVQIEFIEGLDALVIRGHKRDVERVRAIISDIDRIAGETQPSIELYQLQHVGSQVMASLVTEIYTEILSPRQGQVTIRALVKPNALLLIGRPDSVAVIQQLIDKLDTPVEPQSQFEVFPLKHIAALDAEDTLRDFFVDRLSQVESGTQAQLTPRPGLGTRVNIVADYRTNSLIVHAGPRDLEEARRLIARIDVEKAASTNELKIFRLKNALASDVAPVLQDALNWQLIGNRTPVGTQQGGGFGQQGFGQTTETARLRSAALTFMTIDSEGGKLLESGILTDVRVTADVNGNALIVSGPSKSMGLIAALVDALDRLPNAQAQIKVFTIVNGDATALSGMLQNLLGQTAQQGGQQALNTLFGAGAVNPFLTPGLQSAASIGESSLVPVRFGVDQRTNSIIASGSEGDLGVVEAILLRLDEESYKEHLTAVYWLANSSATEVATAVNDWLDSRAAIFDEQIQLSPESPTIQFEREVIVVAEQLSNSIIISATPKWFEEVKRVVESLDRRPPLIKIDVLIAEVDLSNFYEFGAELGLQDALLFDRDGSPGYNFNNQPLGATGGNRENVLGQSLTSFALSRTADTLGYGGLVLSASRDSVSVLIRALSTENRAQILSRPTITTLDGQPSFINVGATVSRLAGTTQNVNTTSQNIEDIPTGITLGVTPRISPDGLVVMEVDVTKSSLSNEGVELPDGFGDTFIQRNIDTITAQTTVSARSGQTVVFSGLIQRDTFTETRGIPYISRVPVVGQLFRFDRDIDRRSELLIILSPHVVRNDEDLDWIKYSETERMSWCLADVYELWGPDDGMASRPGPWCNPCNTPVIFPSTNPTGQLPEVISTPDPIAPPPGELYLPEPQVSAPNSQLEPVHPVQPAGYRPPHVQPQNPMPAAPNAWNAMPAAPGAFQNPPPPANTAQQAIYRDQRAAQFR